MKGIIFDIQRFSIHDGPGIRSTVFTKGCPLNCPWCQNPEGRINNINLRYFQNKCMDCYSCIGQCGNDALSIGENGQVVIDRNKCKRCGNCVEVCPVNAIAFDGKEMDTRQILEILIKDRAFYDSSGGGITISGGDPLCQYEFNLEILKGCKEKEIHTAVETCLYAEKVIVEAFDRLTDLFIIDLKIFSLESHKRITGVNNEIIKNNFEFLAYKGAEILVRIPIIPGYTDSEGNLISIAGYVSGIRKDIKIELMNYNALAKNKYRLLGLNYELDSRLEPYSEEEMDRFKSLIAGEGIIVI